MKKLKPVEKRPIKVYSQIAEKSHQPKKRILLDEKLNIYVRYREYKKNKQELIVMMDEDYTNQDDLKKALLSCYGNNKSLSILKKNIKENQSLYYQATCPYCEIDSPGTFDHYIPKEEFPEFSVMSINLIPCCGTCNSYKGEIWRESNNRTFINYYYDNIPEERFLYARLIYLPQEDIPVVEFEIRNDNGIETQLIKRIESHFKKLHLIERYITQANSKISSIRGTCIKRARTYQLDIVKSLLNDDLETLKDNSGCNNWEYALTEAVLISDEFWNSII